MNKIKNGKYCLAGILIAACLAANSTKTFAAEEAILSEIQINPYHGNTYEVMLVTDKKIPIQRQIISDNEMVIDLRNTIPAKFVNTVYNSVSGIDHVIMQPVSNTHIKVILHGDNISTSKITVNTEESSLFDETATPNIPISEKQTNNTITEEQKPVLTSETPVKGNKNQIVPKQPMILEPVPNGEDTIVLKRPVNEYKPLALYNEENMNEAASDETADTVMTKLSKVFNKNNLDWVLRLFALVILVIGGLKLFNSRKKEVKIDLTPDVDIKKREIDLLKTIIEKQGLIGEGLKDNSKPFARPKNGSYGAISNYGLKEYQNSHTPPLSSINTSTPIERPKVEPKHNRPIQNDPLLRPNTQKTVVKERPIPKAASKISQQDIDTAKVNIDSKKFLETMASLYERGGRADLAYGIKRNIIKS